MLSMLAMLLDYVFTTKRTTQLGTGEGRIVMGNIYIFYAVGLLKYIYLYIYI